MIKDMLGINVVRQYEKYLGLPSLVGQRKTESFTHIKQQVWKKIQGWEAKLLSQAGREILIKGHGTGSPHIHHGLFQIAYFTV